LGHADPELGSTRLADARRILERVCAEECDVFIFLGDLAKNARPGPTAYSIAREALAESRADRFIMVHGNHDHAPGRFSCLDVLSRTLPKAHVYRKPGVLDLGIVQLGVLPWTPISGLFEKAPHEPKRLSQLAAEALCDVARGLGSQLDPDRPAILVGHWLIAGEELASGVSVMETQEPIPLAGELEASGPWDAVIFGHNHQHQQVADHTWSCGPPMRGGFGEETVLTGYMRAEADATTRKVKVKHVPVNDRPMLTIDPLDGVPSRSFKGAIVRLKAEVSEAEAERVNAVAPSLIAELEARGAHKVIGPQLTVKRDRRVRSDLTSEVDPATALDSYLEANGVEEALRPAVREEAHRIMGTAPGKE
jgi:exonuclease SbcC